MAHIEPLTESAWTLEEQEVLERFGTEVEQGLSEDQAAERLSEYGPNVLAEVRVRSLSELLVAQFKSIVIFLLLGAAALAFVTGRLPEAIALLAVIFVNAGLGFSSEWTARRSMESLRLLGKQQVALRRDGSVQNVQAENVVPGDVLLLKAEDSIPADARILRSEQLRVNEAALTGESVPVVKHNDVVTSQAPLAERHNMLYKGTSIAEGSAEAVVTATGMETELGRISELAEQAEGRATPLQKKLDALAKQLAWITIALALLIAGLGIAAGREVARMIETAIALGVAAIPEGLPIVSTIALARGMYLMAQRNAVVNRLTAVETLGATDIIFSDKTGTLTENRMQLRLIITADTVAECVDDGEKQFAEKVKASAVVERALKVAVLCNNSVLNENGSRGDPTEIALLEAGRLCAISRQALLDAHPEKHEIPFDPRVMMMATYHEVNEGIWVAVKGAPERVLERCGKVATEDGLRECTEEERSEWLQRADELAGEGLRLLAVADRIVPTIEEPAYEQLRLLGLVALVDPPRSDIAAAIDECQSAGMRAIMVTGDRADTARAIGQQVGIRGQAEALQGAELEALGKGAGDEALRERVRAAGVFARVSPEHKLRLITFYQDEGHVVAMTGDGVNDAPALKQADIGVAMGQRGTDAARQASDMVLRDDRFSTIVEAVRQGRILFANIRKSVIFMLCTNLAEILVVTVASVAQTPLPLRAMQILYLNVLTDVLPALALGMGAGSREVMSLPPRPREESVLTSYHWRVIVLWSICIGVCVFGSLLTALHLLQLEETAAVTVSFLTLAFAKLWFVLNLRDPGTKLWRNDITSNRWMWAASGVCCGLLLLAVYWPALAHYLHTVPLPPQGWVLVLVASVLPASIGVFAPQIRFYTTRTRT